MLCSQLGNPLSYYGNLQLGFYNPPVYKWGAWVVRDHYQPPLTPAEVKQVEIQHGTVAVDHSELIRRMVADVQSQPRPSEYRKPAGTPIYALPRRVNNNDDDDAMFILM